jgi:acetyltransferase-like isoleucine patch superfamily enzyme
LTGRFDADLREAYLALRQETRLKWERDLPFDELISDRWERARSLGFGEGSSIYGSSYVYGDVKVGSGVWIGPFTILDGTGGLEIGDHCSISAGVQIYSHDSVARAISGGRAPIARSPVVIEARCYIGPQTVISRGVTIGTGAILGAGSFVDRSVPAESFAAGTPARVIGHVEVTSDDEIRIERVVDERR